MKRVHCTIAIVSITAFALAEEEGPRPVSVRDTLSLKSAGNFEWASDGGMLYFTIREWREDENDYVAHIYRVPADGGDMEQMTRGEKSEGNPQVSPDGTYLAFTASRGEKVKPQVFLLPLDGGEAWKLTDAENGVLDFVWSPDSKQVAYTTRDVHEDKKEREKLKKDKFDAVVVDRDFRWTHLWVTGLEEDAKPKRLTEGEFNAGDPQWAPDGSAIAFEVNYVPAQDSPWKHIDDNLQRDIFLIDPNEEEPATINLTPQPGVARAPRWSPGSRSLAFTRAPEPRAKSDLHVLDVESRQARNLTAANPASIGGADWDPDGDALHYTQGQGLYTHFFRIPARGGDSTTLIGGDGVRSSVELSPDGTRIAYIPNDPAKPGDVFAAGLDGAGGVKLTDLNPQAGDFLLGETRPLEWTAEDGLRIEGVLTLPVGYEEGQPYPLIVHIHGGPAGRFTHTFYSRSHFFAGKGYAVLQPNPRGSSGRTHEFMEANLGDWGGRDFHSDDMAGVDLVIEMGIADPDKLVIMGGSYGGFSTFWAVTQTDRFQAAIAHAAISDWYAFHGQTDIPAYLEYGFVGYPWESTEIWRQFSPMSFVTEVSTPLLITHGEKDMRVPIAQAEQYYTALKKLGAVVEFVRYPREGHGIREPNHVLDLVWRQLEWFDRHLGIEREYPKIPKEDEEEEEDKGQTPTDEEDAAA